MFKIKLDDSAIAEVKSRQYNFTYSTDGSQANPMQAMYAALTGCAGIYAKKACAQLGISAEGVYIRCRAVRDSNSLQAPAKIVTRVAFPQHITVEQRNKIMKTMQLCPIKMLISHGDQIQFDVEEMDNHDDV